MKNHEKDRLCLSFRLRPYVGSSLALVVAWLQSLDAHEKKSMIEDALTMMYVVQAKIWSEADLAEIQSVYFLTQQALEKHCSNLQLQYPNLQLQYRNLIADQETPSNIRPKVQVPDVDNLFG